MKNTSIFHSLTLVIAIVLSNQVSADLFVGCNKPDEDNLIDEKPIQTAFGRLEFYKCAVSPQDSSIKHIALGGKEILSESKSLWLSEHDRSKRLFIYEGGDNRTSLIGPCTGTQYLLDLRGKKPRLINFGIKNACNQMDKVIWKKDRAIINFNRDAIFEYNYSTGEMIPPKDDPNRYDPVFDDNSPVIDQYQRGGAPHLRYELAPPYVKEVKLHW